MNEKKIYDFLDMARRGTGTAKAVAAEAAETAADAAYAARQAGTELLANAKVRIRIVEVESDINHRLRELGRMLYNTHTGTPTDSETLIACLEELDRCHAELETLRSGIAKEPTAPVCPTCGAAVQQGDEFCRECGGKL